jgi:RNA polymerase sigma-70 factor (ECF subfamily)
MSEESDFVLLERARQGNLEAFEHLVRRYTPRLYRVIRRIVYDEGEVESILQDTFLRLWENIGRYRNDRPFFPYLVTVALNRARDLWRRENRLLEGEEVLEFLSDQGESDPLRIAEANETLQMLAQAVQTLPPMYRAVIALRYDAELSYEEIAAALDLPINTVRTHLRRARARLRRILEETYGLVR